MHTTPQSLAPSERNIAQAARVGPRPSGLLERPVERVGLRAHLRLDLGGRRRARVAALLRVEGRALDRVQHADLADLDKLLDGRVRARLVARLGRREGGLLEGGELRL